MTTKEITPPIEFTRVMQGLNEELKKTREDEIQSLYADIDKAGGVRESRVLPIELFEEHFLKYFTGKVTDKKEEEFCLTQWASVAGHMGRPVDIIDNKENVLFIIPALRDGDLLDPSKAEAVSFALRQYTYHTQRSPKAAIMYLIQNREKIASNIQVDDIVQKKVQRWESFVNYYNLGKSGSEVSSGLQNGGNIEDDFEFE